MFYGQYRHILDDKSRLFIPAKLRDGSASGETRGFYISTGMEKSLFLHTAEGLGELRKSFAKLSFTNRSQREFQRMFFANTSFSEIDAQGRVLVPDRLRRLADLKKEVAIIGADSRIEVWDEKRWEAYERRAGGRFERTADELFKPFSG